jgi:hypothetical protein
MNNEHITRVAAGKVQIGDELVCNDGAMLKVASVAAEARGFVSITFESFGPLGVCTKRCRATSLLPKFTPNAEAV